MCGIFGILSDKDIQIYKEWFMKIQHRGPDSTNTWTKDHLFLGFHRLAINGLDTLSDQPMIIGNKVLCCNGEIYNFKGLAKEHGIKLQTNSDCEIILHLYEMFGIEKTCKMMNGEFAFMLWDDDKKILYAARDHLGLRGMFWGSIGETIAFASEAKALLFCDKIEQFPPRTYWSSDQKEFISYYEFPTEIISNTEEEICKTIAEILDISVKEKVTMCDRPCGFLLSGGLDSSLCVAIGAKYLKELHTFSIGLVGSLDLEYAQKVAKFLDSNHHQVEYTEEQFLKEIPETIRVIESYDVTTVRASNGHRLIAKYVADKTDIKVLISGEVSDEVTCGYMAFGNINNCQKLVGESIRMLSNIHLYDTLRADRSICSNGLEGRYPFASKDFINYYLSIPGELKTFYKKCRIEKYLLRKAFADQNMLPDEVLWRRKDGFSDGVSSLQRSTHVIMKEYFDKLISDEIFEARRKRYTFNPPETKEALYYREIFEDYYPDRGSLIPGFWLPNPKYYGNKVIEPSGRILDTY